jgi:hypothetical protein
MDRLKFLSFKGKSVSLNSLFGNEPNQYQYIEDFDKVNEDECISLDKKNTEIYKKNCELYKHLLEKIKKQNALFKIENPPSPPLQPNNHSKYITYKLKNSEKNVRLQTFAVLYLIENGYSITYNKNEYSDSFDFEPYEAIEICEKKFDEKIENIFKRYQENRTNLKKSMSINIPPIYNSNDTYNLNNTQFNSKIPIPSAPSIYPPVYPQIDLSYLSASAPPANRNYMNNK